MSNKSILVLILTFLIQLSGETVTSQCDTLTLRTQIEVDSFQIIFGPCETIDYLGIDQCDTCDIQNVVGLNGVKYISRLYISSNTLHSLEGFQNLRKVDYLQYNSQANIAQGFPTLDSILELRHEFSALDQDLDIYQNVGYIRNLFVEFDGSFKGLDSFQPHQDFSLSVIRNNTHIDLQPIFKNYTGEIDIIGFSLCSNIDLFSITQLERTGLSLAHCHQLDLTPLLKYDGFDHLSFWEGDSILDLRGGFENIDSLDRLYVLSTKEMESLSELVPNLKAVREVISLRRNAKLNSIELMSDFPELKRGTLTGQNERYIDIWRNPMLETCSNPFICRAVESISDDSLRIYGNGAYCHEDSLLVANCLTVDGKDIEENFEVRLTPNPTSSLLRLENCHHGSYTINSIMGMKVLSGKLYEGSIDVSQLRHGSYILRLSDGQKWGSAIFVKQ